MLAGLLAPSLRGIATDNLIVQPSMRQATKVLQGNLHMIAVAPVIITEL